MFEKLYFVISASCGRVAIQFNPSQGLLLKVDSCCELVGYLHNPVSAACLNFGDKQHPLSTKYSFLDFIFPSRCMHKLGNPAFNWEACKPDSNGRANLKLDMFKGP